MLSSAAAAVLMASFFPETANVELESIPSERTLLSRRYRARAGRRIFPTLVRPLFLKIKKYRGPSLSS